MNTGLIALHIKPLTTSGGHAHDKKKQSLQENLQLAEELKAEVVVLHSDDPAGTILEYARVRQVSRILIGRDWSKHSLFTFWKKNLVKDLVRRSENLDVFIISGEHIPETFSLNWPRTQKKHPFTYIMAGLILVTSLGINLFFDILGFDLANIIMVFLLAVVSISSLYGFYLGIIAALFGVLSFNYFFTEPRYSFTIHSPQYIITFFIMMLVALLVSTLTARIREQALQAKRREWQKDALYRLTGQLARCTGEENVLIKSKNELEHIIPCHIDFIKKDQFPALNPKEKEISEWVWAHKAPAGKGTKMFPAANVLYLPLKGSRELLAVMAFGLTTNPDFSLIEERTFLETLAAQI
jgi:two-component system sensor histidine kinase KdpD